MDIYGIQKLSLLDFPGKVACTVFTKGCNFKCPFCHNAPLVTDTSLSPMMEEEEFFSYLGTRKGKLDGVCITGGEPTLQKDLKDFIRRIKAEGFLVKLDTNGTNPKLLKELAGEGLLDYVAVDIKSSKKEYAGITAVNDEKGTLTDRVDETVSFLKTGVVPFEFRTTIVEEYHTPEIMKELAVWIAGEHPYYLQQFEDSGNLVGSGCHALSEEVLKEYATLVEPWLPRVSTRGID